MGRRVFLAPPAFQGHGKPSYPRDRDPTMFESLSWVDEAPPSTSLGLARAEPPAVEEASPQACVDTGPALAGVQAPPPASEAAQVEAPSAEDPPKQALAPKRSAKTAKDPKHIFYPYGLENVYPVNGGVGYGDYLVSHNVNAHRSDVRHVFPTALRRIGADVPPTQPLVPKAPMTKAKRRPAPTTSALPAPAPAHEPVPPPPPQEPVPASPPSAAPKPVLAAPRPAGIPYLHTTKIADCLAW